MERITLTLPTPPSVNTYWSTARGGRKYLSPKAVQFKKDTKQILINEELLNLNITERLKIQFFYYPPDRRTRDLDNFFKGVFDALRDGNLFADDEQIDVIYAEKREVIKGGKVIVIIETI